MPTLDLNIVKRLEKGSPLTAQEMDDNLCQFYDAWQALIDLVTSVIGVDGKLADCSVVTDSLCDRIVTQAKRAWGSDFIADDTGVADAVAISFTPAITAYSTKALVAAKIKATNTGPATINIDGIGATTIKKHGTEALEAGDLVAGKVSLFAYDGTNFQLLNPTKFNVTVTAPTTTQLAKVTDPFIIQHTPPNAILTGTDFLVDHVSESSNMVTPTYATGWTTTEFTNAYGEDWFACGTGGVLTRSFHCHMDYTVTISDFTKMLASVASINEIEAVRVTVKLRGFSSSSGANGLFSGFFYQDVDSNLFVPISARDYHGVAAASIRDTISIGTFDVPVDGALTLRAMFIDDYALNTTTSVTRHSRMELKITHLLLRQ